MLLIFISIYQLINNSSNTSSVFIIHKNIFLRDLNVFMNSLTYFFHNLLSFQSWLGIFMLNKNLDIILHRLIFLFQMWQT